MGTKRKVRCAWDGSNRCGDLRPHPHRISRTPSVLARNAPFLSFPVGSSWSSAPTLVERQRENLTERLRREFGLFVNDDEEAERLRKQGKGCRPVVELIVLRTLL